MIIVEKETGKKGREGGEEKKKTKTYTVAL